MCAKSAVCLATSANHANHIVHQLKGANFSGHDISVLFTEEETTFDFGHDNEGKPTEAAVADRGICGAIMEELEWGTANGLLVIPGEESIIAAGPITAALNKADCGGIADGLIGLGIPESDAKRYEFKIKLGDILVSVRTKSSGRITRATNIFTQAWAQDICTTSEDSTPEDSTASACLAYR